VLDQRVAHHVTVVKALLDDGVDVALELEMLHLPTGLLDDDHAMLGDRQQVARQRAPWNVALTVLCQKVLDTHCSFVNLDGSVASIAPFDPLCRSLFARE
jgi:hypothetical protein